MKFKLSLISLLLCIILGAGSVFAAPNDALDGVVKYKLENSGASSVQELIDTELTQNAGTLSEWYVLSLASTGNYDFSKYENALLDYLSTHTVYSATTRQKYALTLFAIGSDSEYIENTLSESVGKLGIMSYVYGLHLLNNKVKCDSHTDVDVAEHILSLQQADGGWGLTTASDPDVTAMVIASLAPLTKENEKIASAVEKALDRLSQMQTANGDFISYGVENPESTCQVLIALCALDIDCTKDARFIKNGKTLIDVIEKYRLENGSFCHVIDGNFNENATASAYLAFSAYKKLLDGKGSLYIFAKNSETPPSPPVTTTPDTGAAQRPPVTEKPSMDSDVTEKIPDSTDRSDGNGGKRAEKSYKPVAIIAVAGVGALALVLLFVFKKHKIGNVIALLVAVAIAISVICVTDIKSAEDYYSDENAAKDDPTGTVFLTIRCDSVADSIDSEFIPDDGFILKEVEMEIEEGDTVYTVLTDAAKIYKLQIENNGTKDSAYIAGINYLYEFQHGDMAGWIFFVNGEMPSESSSTVEVKDGDRIEWVYSLTLGKDF